LRNLCDSTSLPDCLRVDLTKNSSSRGAITGVGGIDYVNGSLVKMFACDYDMDFTRQDIRNHLGIDPDLHFNRIVDMKEPLDSFSHENREGVSFASSFANEYIRRNGSSMASARKKLLIVGCGVSATSLSEWKGDLAAQTIERLRKVRSLLTPTNTSKVVAFLWHQGESDMNNTIAPIIIGGVFQSNEMINKKINIFKLDLQRLLSGMRTDIIGIFTGNNGNYRFPILIGGLCYHNRLNAPTGDDVMPYLIRFSNIMSQISNPTDQFYLEKSSFVSTDILTVGGPIYDFRRALVHNGSDDPNHFSATSMRELGKRYYYYYDLIKNTTTVTL
jgi:hypothetical protein